jgi:hypothetical protein
MEALHDSESRSNGSAEGAERPVAIVTGASEGFGRELTRLIAADGYDLVVVARNEARLRELAAELESDCGVSVAVRPADLSDPAEQLALASEVNDQPRLAIFVNNAAFSLVDAFHELPLDGVQQMVSLNLGALATLTHAALNNADFRRGGTLVNVGSIGGTWPLPFDAIYSATKAAIHHFTAAVAYEVAKNPELDVHVQVAQLGGLNTGWADRAMGELKPGEARDPVIHFLQNDPAAAARTIWRRVKQRRKRVFTDHWMATLQTRIFRRFQRAGTAMVYANTDKERARRNQRAGGAPER